MKNKYRVLRLLAASLAPIWGLALHAQTVDAPQEQHSKAVKSEGEVRLYEQGKKISITIRPQVEQTYDLSAKDTNSQLDRHFMSATRSRWRSAKTIATTSW